MSASSTRTNADAELRGRFDRMVSKLALDEDLSGADRAEVTWLRRALSPEDARTLESSLSAWVARCNAALEKKRVEEVLAADAARRSREAAAEAQRQENWKALSRVEKALWLATGALGYEARARELLGFLIQRLADPRLEQSEPPPGFGDPNWLNSKRW